MVRLADGILLGTDAYIAGLGKSGRSDRSPLFDKKGLGA